MRDIRTTLGVIDRKLHLRPPIWKIEEEIENFRKFVVCIYLRDS